MAPTNVKADRQISLLHIESNPDRLGLIIVVAYARPAFSATVLINKPKFLKASRHAEIRKLVVPRSKAIEAFELVKPARESASSHPKPCAPLKPPPENLARLPLLVSPLKQKTDHGQRSAFPSETSRFASLILAHKGSVIPWLVDHRAALRPRRIWSLLTR